jgi:hypothetical protein
MDTSLEELKYPIGRYERPDHYTPELLQEWIAILRALPSWMDVCIENLDAAQLRVPYREGGWNTQQVIHHVADSHTNAYIRIRLALTEDNPTVKPYDENAWALLPDVDTVPVNVSITLLHAMHRRLVALMEVLTPAQWERTYYHPQYQRNFAVWEMASLYAWHSRHHTGHIQQLRLRMGWQ